MISFLSAKRLIAAGSVRSSVMKKTIIPEDQINCGQVLEVRDKFSSSPAPMNYALPCIFLCSHHDTVSSYTLSLGALEGVALFLSIAVILNTEFREHRVSCIVASVKAFLRHISAVCFFQVADSCKKMSVAIVGELVVTSYSNSLE